jgi:hypothetical protein
LKKTKPKNPALEWIEQTLAKAKSPLEKRFIELFLEFLAVHMDIPQAPKLDASDKDWEEIKMVSTLVYLYIMLYDLGESLKDEAVTDEILLEEVNNLFDENFQFSIEYLISHRRGFKAIGLATEVILSEPSAAKMVSYCRDAYEAGRKATIWEN